MDIFTNFFNRSSSYKNSFFAMIFFLLFLIVNIIMGTIDGISIASSFFVGYFACKIRYEIE